MGAGASVQVVPGCPTEEAPVHRDIHAKRHARESRGWPRPPGDLTLAEMDAQTDLVAPARPAGRTKTKKMGPVAVALAFLAGKLKWAFAVFKLVKLATLASMLLAIGVYATLWGLPFALGFVALLFVHEMGHAIAMRREGIPASAPVFIPFVGAVIAMRGMPRDAWVEAVVGIGGPVLGTAGAAACLVVAFVTGSPFWFALASTGFMLNLFNMIPVSPLDGGRVVGVVSRWLWAVGFVVGIAVFFVTRSPLLLIILLLGALQLWKSLKAPRTAYYDVPVIQRVTMGGAYFGLLALMTLGMWVSEGPLHAVGGNQLMLTEGATLLFGSVPLFAGWARRLFPGFSGGAAGN